MGRRALWKGRAAYKKSIAADEACRLARGIAKITACVSALGAVIFVFLRPSAARLPRRIFLQNLCFLIPIYGMIRETVPYGI